ncbi:MAG TPA: vWA domain-containing protein [Kofleriaceae bacterium]|nr:vWA domain-containing protein [Kofleriaceae bacterium]
MPTRQHLATYGVSTLAAATITIAALLQPWRGSEHGIGAPVPVGPERAERAEHAVDVVFAVDTTGSMGGLLEGAKRTVWSIATHIRKTDPGAQLRVGLVAYRDIGDDYVTRDLALTSDLDAVFAELSSYRAAGGGDTPEDVDAALDDTLHKMAWRADARKLVFLVGDAPPASRGDVPRFDVLAREAGERQILLNTIRCGWDPDTERAWQQIAELGHGQFSTIQQDGGVQQIATPYDARIAEVSARIDETTVIVGDEGERRAYHKAMAAAAEAPAPAKADRAAYYVAKGSGAGGGGRADKDLVGGIASGTMSLDDVAPAALPEDLRGMGRPALQKEIERRAELRRQAQDELTRLTRQRDEYLEGQARTGEGGFDAKVKAAIDVQLQ